jgi:hypothetical protein
MKTGIGAIIGAIICFFALKHCEKPQEVRTVTKIKHIPTYVHVTKEVNVPVTKIKYKTLYSTDKFFIHDTLDRLVEVTRYDSTKSLAVIPYQDSLVTINDSITLTGQIVGFKRKIVVREKQPDTLTITKETIKYFKGIKYYVGLDSDFNNLFQPSFGLSYDSKKFQVSLGYRPVTKVVEAKLFLPLIKL